MKIEQQPRRFLKLPTPAGIGSSGLLDDVLKQLTEREQKILRMRFGVNMRAHTLREVGNKLNVTRERVRQIENKALRKLRQPDREHLLRNFLEVVDASNVKLCEEGGS